MGVKATTKGEARDHHDSGLRIREEIAQGAQVEREAEQKTRAQRAP